MNKEKLTLEKYIYISAMKDVAHQSLIALPFIALFEILMLINWCLGFDGWNCISTGRLISYSGLLLTSIVCFFLMRSKRKDCEKNYLFMLRLQYFYAILIFVWALAITVLDSLAHDSVDILVYVTIIALVPIFCFINSSYWIAIQLFSAAAVILLIYRYDPHPKGVIINFLVFTIISIIAQRTLYRIRKYMYTRQYELDESRDKEYRLAHIDTLTGLYNRRSYQEALELLENTALPQDLLVISIDINGLKHTNDTRGHKAGDELITAAADIGRRVFEPYGKIYRTGGDEFMALLNLEKDKFEEVRENFQKNICAWKGIYCSQLTVSIGFAFRSDHPEMSFSDLEKTADDNMYEMKRCFYNQTGTDR